MKMASQLKTSLLLMNEISVHFISQSLRKGSDVVEGSTLTVDVAAKPTEKKDTTKSDSTPSDSSGSSGSPTGDKEGE